MLFDIDFDFFVKETKPHDFGYIEQPFFMNDIWNIRFASLYSSYSDLTKEIILDKEGLERIISFVENCDIENWGISESHLYAYRYIEDLIIEHNDNYDKILDILKIVHIDKHSDLDILDGKIHAGNWLRYIIKNYIRKDLERADRRSGAPPTSSAIRGRCEAAKVVYDCQRAERTISERQRAGLCGPTKSARAGRRIRGRACATVVYWINQNNNKNFKDYSFGCRYDTNEIKRLVRIRDINFLDKLDPLKIHNLFLCRSSAWVPPWLDKPYFQLQRKFEKLFGKPDIYDPIPKIRRWNYNQMVDMATKERKLISHDETKYIKIEI